MNSERLKLIATKVKKGASVIDVGTDHAYIPIYLMKKGIAKKALATDIGKGPLDRAKQNIALHGVNVETFLANGLEGIDTSEFDTVIIAGMGGILISEILEATPCDKTFILQPMTMTDKLRRYLSKNGYVILDETLVVEDGKLYTVLVAGKGESEEYSEIEYFIGKKLYNDPLFPELCERLYVKFKTAAQGIEKSKNQKQLNYYKKLLLDIEERKNKKWQK